MLLYVFLFCVCKISWLQGQLTHTPFFPVFSMITGMEMSFSPVVQLFGSD